MRYEVNVSQEAKMDLQRLLHNEPNAYKKAIKLIGELYEHPKDRDRASGSITFSISSNQL